MQHVERRLIILDMFRCVTT